jgi:hypothetical protein
MLRVGIERLIDELMMCSPYTGYSTYGSYGGGVEGEGKASE